MILLMQLFRICLMRYQLNVIRERIIEMNQNFYEEIKNILIIARNKVYQTANFAMVEAYWNIGKSIIEE